MANIEIYSKDWCPYCEKAKALLDSKGLRYQTIDITADAEREYEMIQRSERRTVPQIFIEGQSIGGYDDLAQLNATGELDRRLGITSQQNYNKVYDVTVIGAGPAGMSAAIYTARKNLSTLVISMDIGGQLGTTREVANYPGLQQVEGPQLVRMFEQHMDQHALDKQIGERVTGLRFEDRCKILETASGKEICTRSVIIASGAHKRKLEIPGETELAGRGVVYCSTCDGPLFKDMAIAIVGGGNSGLEAAIEMDSIAKQVYLLSRGAWSGDRILQDKIASCQHVEVLENYDPIAIHGSDQVQGFTVKNLKTKQTRRLDVQGVFVEIGLFPNTDFILDLLETNERAEIKIDSQGHVGMNGIFAAGDVTDIRDKQIVIAAGAGANAALNAFEYLITQH